MKKGLSGKISLLIILLIVFRESLNKDNNEKYKTNFCLLFFGNSIFL